MLGFLGGASWAILVAKACLMAEGQVSSMVELIYFFFLTFATWEWPTPVYIKKYDVAPYPGVFTFFPLYGFFFILFLLKN